MSGKKTGGEGEWGEGERTSFSPCPPVPLSPCSSLLILGASARAAAQSALRAGLTPKAIDLFGDADLRAIAETRRIEDYPAGFERVFEELPSDYWLYTGGLENYPALIDRLARRRPLLGNRGAALRRVLDPFWLADCLRTEGFDFPRTVSRRSETTGDGEWLRKPYRGSAGLGITRCSSPSVPLSPSPPLAKRSRARHYYQQLRPGTPASAVFVAAEGKSILLGATRQLIGPPWTEAGRFVYAGSIGPITLTPRAATTIAEFGNLLARRAELVGLFGVDFLLDGEGICVLEVNPRYPASLEILERATGEPLLAWHLAACLQGELLPPPLSSDGACHGKALLYAREPIAITAAQAAELARERSSPWPEVADLPMAAARVERNQPVLTVFCHGREAEIEKQLHQRLDRQWQELNTD